MIKWSELSNKDKVKLIITEIKKWPHVFEKYDEYYDRLWETGNYVSIGYPVAVLHGQRWTVFYEEEQDGCAFNPLLDMNAAWQIVVEMNKPQDGSYDRYGRFIEELERLIGSKLLFDALNTEKGNASYAISTESIAIAALKAVGVEVEA